MPPSREDTLRLYEKLYLIRRTEEEVARVYPTDKIKSPIHLSIGQEAASVAVIDTLERTDVVAASYRCHAAYLANGGPLGGMIAEMYGKVTGVARGKGGSMHLVDPVNNMMGTSAIVASQIPLAVGAALSQRMSKSGAIVAVFMGDGATEEGVFHESLNFAALRRLPVLFVCENNGYAIHSPLSARWASPRLSERVATYDIPVERVIGGDIFQMRDRAAQLVAGIRKGDGPAFLEIETYRWKEHVGPGGDYDAGYRSIDELAPWIQADQVTRLANMIDPAERDPLEARIERTIKDAFVAAEAAAPPPPEDLLSHVYA